MKEPQAENLHKSVLAVEVIRLFEPLTEGTIVDATLGLGGHTELLLDSKPNVTVIGIDQDSAAIELARERLGRFGSRFAAYHSNFSAMGKILSANGISNVKGVLADLGVSSLQFDSPERGFSFRFDAPLDMRMDPDSDLETAADLLETLSEEEIANIIYQFGEERASRRIARRIVARRAAGSPVRTTKELADLVASAVRRGKRDKIHPATRTFQALRIAVNQEIEVIEGFILDSIGILEPGGILQIISFHSIEDRVVKRVFQRLSGRCFCPPRMPQCQCGAVKAVDILTKKPIAPSEKENDENPRARSAKLRAVMKRQPHEDLSK
jgi:16S rRNA (cytosine1402-N4)-methyltransferase